MKKALVCMADGLGDWVQYGTPHLRYLYNNGYKCDIMCREEISTSHLLDDCPYIDELIHIPNPWKFKKPEKTVKQNFQKFNKLRKEYDVAYNRPFCQIQTYHKLDMTSKFFGIKELEGEERYPEVFIPEECEEEAEEYVKDVFDDEPFMFVHTEVKDHPAHTWPESYEWIKDNFEPMNIHDTRFQKWENINTSFAVMKRASRIILSSSVFLCAADAMNLYVDAANYGYADRKASCLRIKPRRIREMGYWIDV